MSKRISENHWQKVLRKRKNKIKLDKTRKPLYLLLHSFDNYCQKIFYEKRVATIDCIYTKFWDFLIFLDFGKSYELNHSRTSEENCIKAVRPDFKVRFTCGEFSLYRKTVNCKNIMSLILWKFFRQFCLTWSEIWDLFSVSNSLRSQVLSCQLLVRQLVNKVPYAKFHVPFYVWRNNLAR